MLVNPLPTVNAGTYSNACAGGTAVNLVGTPTGGSFSGLNVSSNQFTPTAVGTYTVSYQYTNSNGCSNTATGSITVINCNSTLNLKLYLEGYYVGAGNMTNTLYNQGVDPNPTSGITDEINVELHQTSSPYALAYTYTGYLQTNGTINCSFPAAVVGNSYYIVIKHRNSLQTWSANPFTFSTSNSYDFTTAASKAYGSNQAALGSNLYGLFTGDINQDLVIDAFDYLALDADISLGSSGYYVTDLNGDGSVDAFDFLAIEPNLLNGLTIQAP
jgi:hypothetical protein